ncbi:hypothetical protein AUK22_01635 [bacterium CG2_30_54_10]|nr:MAG: hypothetical protein AUK22_01635 [bacterium CG2_30_54_10]
MKGPVTSILISACLFGKRCNYRGDASPLWGSRFSEIEKTARKGGLVFEPLCPEQLGGLTTPRPRSELQAPALSIVEGRGRVETEHGIDVTAEFLAGAKESLSRAGRASVKWAVLKEKSPSCGSKVVHDGFFSGALVEGPGITAFILKKNGIFVFNEIEFLRLWKWFGGADFLQNPLPFLD